MDGSATTAHASNRGGNGDNDDDKAGENVITGSLYFTRDTFFHLFGLDNGNALPVLLWK
jgi:hypothetical protein